MGRPQALTLCAFLLSFSGSLALLGSLGWNGATSLFEIVGIVGPGVLFFSMGGFLPFVFLVTMATAVGLWKEMRWSWAVFLFASFANASVYGLLVVSGVYSAAPAFAANLTIAFYLGRKEVSSCFHSGSKNHLARRETGRVRAISLPIAFLLISSAFSPAIQIELKGATASASVTPLFRPGFESVRVGSIVLAYRMRGLIPELGLEPMVSTTYLGTPTSRGVGSRYSRSKSEPTASPSPPLSIPSALSYGSDPSQSLCNDTLYAGQAAQFRTYVDNPTVNQAFGCMNAYASDEQAMAYDPNNGYVFAVSSDFPSCCNTTVSAIDDLSGKVVANITSPQINAYLPYSTAMVFDPSNNLLYVTGEYVNSTLIINASSLSYVGKIWIGNGGGNGGGYSPRMALDPSNGYLYITDVVTGTLLAVDTSTNALVANITLPSAPSDVVYDSYSNRLFVSYANTNYYNITVIDPATEEPMGNITIPNQLAYNTAYDSSNHLLYAEESNASPLTLFVINGTSDQYTSSVSLGNATYLTGGLGDELFFNPGNNEIYGLARPQFGGNSIVVYNPLTGSAEEISVCAVPVLLGTECGPDSAVYDSWNGVMYFAMESGYIVGVPTVAGRLPRDLVFTETGIQPGFEGPSIKWNVTVTFSGQGTSGARPRSFTQVAYSPSPISFVLPEGYTYSYTVPELLYHGTPDYLPQAYSPQFYLPTSGNPTMGQEVYLGGSVALPQTGYGVPVVFAQIFKLSFALAHPPQNGASLSATINQCLDTLVPGGTKNCANEIPSLDTLNPSNCVMGSPSFSTLCGTAKRASGTAAFYVPDGNYAFALSLPGYFVKPSDGVVSISGNDVTVKLSSMLLNVGQGVITAYGDLFAVNPAVNGLFVFDAATSQSLGSAADLPSCTCDPNPVSLANATIGPLNLVLVVNEGANNVSIVDASTGVLLKSVAVGSAPLGIAVQKLSSTQDVAYVTDFLSEDIAVIALKYSSAAQLANEVTATVSFQPLSFHPTGVAVEAYGDAVYVSDYDSSSVDYFNYLFGGLISQGSITVGAGPMGLVTDEASNLLVANSMSDSVTVVPSDQSGGGNSIQPPDLNSCSQSCPSVAVAGNPVGIATTEPMTASPNLDAWQKYLSWDATPGAEDAFVIFNGTDYATVINGYGMQRPVGAGLVNVTMGSGTVDGIGFYNGTATVGMTWTSMTSSGGTGRGISYLVFPTTPVSFSFSLDCSLLPSFAQSICRGFNIWATLDKDTLYLKDGVENTLYLPYSTYQLNDSLPVGLLADDAQCVKLWGTPCATATGNVALGGRNGAYTVTPGECTANSAEVSDCLVSLLVVPQPEPLWANDPNFNINTVSISPQAMAGVVTAVSGGALAPAAAPLLFANSQTESVIIYTINPASGVSAQEYNKSVINDLGIGAPSGYLSASVTLVHLPISVLSLVMGLPGVPGEGSVNLVDIDSIPVGQVNSGLDYATYGAKLLSGIAGILGPALLCLIKPSPTNCSLSWEGITSVSNTGTGSVGFWSALLKYLTDLTGDITLGAISDIGASGQLAAATLLDFVLILKDTQLFNAIVAVLTASVSLMLDIIKLWSMVLAWDVQAVGEVIKTLADFFNFGLNVVNLVLCTSLNPDESKIQGTCNTLTVIRDVTTAVAAVGSLLAADPNGVSEAPSYYAANGTLVLGYDPTTGTMVYNSSAGFIVGGEDFYYTYFLGKQNLTLVLGTVGTNNATVPYTVDVYPTAPTYVHPALSGEIETGTLTTIAIDYSQNGTLIQPIFLEPRITTEGVGGNYTVLMTPYLSNGTKVTASAATLTLNNTVYQMHAVNSTLFSSNVSYFSEKLTPFTVEVQALGVPGGAAEGILPAAGYTVTFAESGLSSGGSWAVDFNGSTVSSTSNRVVFSTPGNGTYPYSVEPGSGYAASPAAGKVTIDGSNAQVSVAFAPTSVNTTTISRTGTTSPSGGVPLTYILAGALAVALVVALVAGIFVLVRRRTSPRGRIQEAG
ncbi:MAG: hypothetical protein JRN06_09255 [Nitrososphaerota archaeon]|nr:hypothetical protein [Nitrososphaerota archaeon]